MTYDNWKCTDPNDQWLVARNSYGMAKAWQDFEDGGITLDAMGDVLLEQGYEPSYVREILSRHTLNSIPVGYFGEEL